MSAPDSLEDLCIKIKQLVPPIVLNEPTGKFEKFIQGLELSIKKDDIEAIKRAYNYFNILLGNPPDEVVKSKSLREELKDGFSAAAKEASSLFSYTRPNTGSTQVNQEAKEPPTGPDSPEKMEAEMIDILYSVAESEKIAEPKP